MKTHHTLLPLIALTILALALPCCRADSDSTEPAAPVSTRFAISSRAQESVADNELIHDYTVTFVNNVSTVCAVVERDESAAGFEHDEFDVELNPGYYTVYAYANRSALPENIRTALGSLSEGAPLPEGFADLTADFPAYAGAGSLIPMSGVMNGVEISSRPGVNTSIEVIRMLARVEFEFSNASSDPIEVTGVTFGPVYSGDVTALPVFDNNSRDIARPVILDGSLASTVEHDVDVRLAGEQRTLASHFYIRESVADSHPTGQFTFAVRVQRNGREEETLRPRPRHQRHPPQRLHPDTRRTDGLLAGCRHGVLSAHRRLSGRGGRAEQQRVLHPLRLLGQVHHHPEGEAVGRRQYGSSGLP